MRKQLLLVPMLVIAVGGFAFANGQYEAQRSLEPVTITGTLQFEGDDHPALKAADGVYELMVPMHLASQVDVEEGQEITVEGYLVPGPRWGREGEETYLRVTKALIGGEEYVVDEELGGPCCEEPRAGDWGRGGMRGKGMQGRGSGRGMGSRSSRT